VFVILFCTNSGMDEVLINTYILKYIRKGLYSESVMICKFTENYVDGGYNRKH